MKYKVILLCLFICNSIAHAATPNAAPTVSQLSTCSSIETAYSIKNGAVVPLDNIKSMIAALSVFTQFTPFAAAEDIMKLPAADNMVFYCADTSTAMPFRAQIFFTYMDHEKKIRTPTIQLTLVPPYEPRPKRIDPPAPAADVSEEPAPVEKPAAPAQPSYSDQLK